MTKLKLLDSRDESGNIRTFIFETGGRVWAPGQYQEYTLDTVPGDEKAKKHYFTISSAPSENTINISTRVTDSDFKQHLNALQPGDAIEADNPEGDFIWNDDAKIVMVAGGIGVTPFRSMITERSKAGQSINAHLLYFGRDENFAFRGEFDEIVKSHPELTISYMVGQPITAESILKNAPEAKDQTVYLSGPEPMVDAIGEELKKAGVALQQDWFPGYDEHSY